MLSNSTKININEARRAIFGKRIEDEGKTQQNYDIVVSLRRSVLEVVIIRIWGVI